MSISNGANFQLTDLQLITMQNVTGSIQDGFVQVQKQLMLLKNRGETIVIG